jgi:hypothetical protein
VKRHRVGVRRGERPTSIHGLFYNFERGALAMARGRAGEQRPNSVNGLPAAADHAANVALAKLKFENDRSAARNFREHHVVGKFDQFPKDELEKFSHDRRLTTNAHESTPISARIKNPGVRNKCLCAFGGHRPPLQISAFFDYRRQVCVGSSAAVSATEGSGDAGVVSAGAGRAGGSDEASAGALTTCFLFLLIKLRTVSEACAPLLIQYSARSSFNVLL